MCVRSYGQSRTAVLPAAAGACNHCITEYPQLITPRLFVSLRAAAHAQNFGTVEEGVFRSGMPNELNFPFLEKLRLKTIVIVSPEEPSARLYVV